MRSQIYKENNENITLPPLIDDILHLLQDSSFKGAAIHRELNISIYNYKKPPQKKLYFHKLEQKMMSYNLAVFLPYQQPYLGPTFNWKIRQLIEGGFFEHWISNYMKHHSIIEKDLEDDKVVLTMNDHLYR